MLLIADSYAIASMLASASTVVTQWGSFLNGANFSTLRAFVAFRIKICSYHMCIVGLANIPLCFFVLPTPIRITARLHAPLAMPRDFATARYILAHVPILANSGRPSDLPPHLVVHSMFNRILREDYI
ncbi:hypothetical protein OPQ81_007760 [Rhizoctonia solani]|nr:hypothetical protein OPQ81_007760 [Rhizoctonia solani]